MDLRVAREGGGDGGSPAERPWLHPALHWHGPACTISDHAHASLHVAAQAKPMPHLGT